jgi:hypothetical protein
MCAKPGRWVLLSVAVVIIVVGLNNFDKWATSIHQRSVTRSLADWSVEYAQITNEISAVKAAELVEYVSRYYVPGPGYEGFSKTEAALQAQRGQTIATMVSALQNYTGLEYGTNVEAWSAWATANKSTLKQIAE